MQRRKALRISLFVFWLVVCFGGDLSTQGRDWARGCGNGRLDSGEECDPGFPGVFDPDLGGKTCESEGYSGGDLACTLKCQLDRSACDCEAGAALPATGQSTCWDANGVPIECGGTGQDGDIRAGAPLSYTDNGDGTITDNNTKLTWEAKNDSGGIHDKDITYVWEDAFSSFIDALNNTCSGDGLVQCDGDDFCGTGGRCGLAGHRDWRMPNVKELQSIVDYNAGGPTVHPAFNTGCVSRCTECSCTVLSFYWSSSSFALSPNYAWLVYFLSGDLDVNFKGLAYYVRAVRGGS